MGGRQRTTLFMIKSSTEEERGKTRKAQKTEKK